jgi:hypothetical protein
MNKRLVPVLVIVGALVLGACASRGGGDDTAATATTAPDATTVSADFGDLESPCGPGDATIDPSQNGGPTLKVGTPTDKGFSIVPGLNVEMEDAAKAFIAWCNEQGGVQGLPLELVELDAAYFEVPSLIEKACDQVFAMVGGGLVLDDQVFPRFNECGMIDIAGFTVTSAKSESSGMAQPLPNPSKLKPVNWLQWAKENYPTEIERTSVMYGNIGSIETVALQDIALMEALGGFTVVSTPVYNPGGEANWAPFAQQLKDDNITFLTFVGQPANLASLLRSMDEIGYRPTLIMQEANFYDEVLTDGAGSLADGVIVRSFYTPFEEPDESPAMAKYLELMKKYNPSGKIAGLGIQSMSAYLMFVTASNLCLDNNDGVLERECVLEAALTINEWTGGGLHAPSNPGANEPSNCGLLFEISGGEFTRLFPQRGSADDNGGGWNCLDPGLQAIEGNFGDATAGVDPSRKN